MHEAKKANSDDPVSTYFAKNGYLTCIENDIASESLLHNPSHSYLIKQKAW